LHKTLKDNDKERSQVANAQTFWLENLKVADRYNDWIFSQVKPHLGNDVLEVGCGNGNFTVFLAQQSQKVTSLDLDESYIRMTKSRLAGQANVEVLLADATTIGLQRSFDTVIMLDVLEHIEDDIGMLKKLSGCLRTGGKLIIKVPALSCLYSPLDSAIGHYRRYHKTTLKRAIKKAYFADPLMWNFNIAGIPGWWLNGKVLKRTTPAAEQVGLFNKVVPLLRTIEGAIEPPVGLSLFAVATKP
jgi:2-polyprenyl-3-methyl-5-hydroxy-6-metoxy-1,4-benzoquinol methylase